MAEQATQSRTLTPRALAEPTDPVTRGWIGTIVGPAAVAGALSAALVSLGGHPTLFAATALVAAAGSVFVWRIKSGP